MSSRLRGHPICRREDCGEAAPWGKLFCDAHRQTAAGVLIVRGGQDVSTLLDEIDEYDDRDEFDDELDDYPDDDEIPF